MLRFEFADFFTNGWRQLGAALRREGGCQSRLARESIGFDPQGNTAFADVEFLTHKGQAEALVLIEPDRLEFFGRGVAPSILGGASPPRGARGSLRCYGWFSHVNTSFIIEVSTTFRSKSVS